MTNLTKLDFSALDVTGKNYLSWVLDAEIHLVANGLGEAIKEGNKATSQEKAKTMIFLCHHLDEKLKTEYLTMKDPFVLWTNLKDKYDHHETVILPKARYEWMHLRLQDFKCVSEYNSAIFKISSRLKLCGENVTDQDLLEKTFSTFHASNVLLQQQYREKGFKKYSELISCLLVAEQNNEFLLKNHQARPTGAAPFPEANATAVHSNFKNNRGCGSGRARGHVHYNYHRGGHAKVSTQPQKRERNDENCGGRNSKKVDNECYRCGMKDHWSRTCRTPKHLVDLYQQSIKNKDKKIETHFVGDDAYKDLGLSDNSFVDFTFLDVADFFINEPEACTSGNIQG